MADPRINSGHLRCVRRRRHYQTAREALLGARGWLTLAAEGLHRVVGGGDEELSMLPVRLDHLLGPKYLLNDQQAGYCYPLKTGLNTIGRLPDNDIVLEGSAVSRRHCVILVHVWGGCELHDTASRNGTWVNGERFHQPVRLASGDQIQVCQKLLLLVNESDDQADMEADDHPSTVLVGGDRSAPPTPWRPG